MSLNITRDNIDALLDRHAIQYYSPHRGKWYDIRRNGQTKRWKRDASRITVPCKIGFREAFQITEADFRSHDRRALDMSSYRVKPELERQRDCFRRVPVDCLGRKAAQCRAVCAASCCNPAASPAMASQTE